MSRRWGIGIPVSSFANDSSGDVVLVMSHPQAMQKARPPPYPAAVRGRIPGLGKSEQVVVTPRLLQFDDGALRFELLFDFFRFLLGHTFLYGAGRAFDQILRLFQAEAGYRADLLDQLDLLLAAGLQHDGELRLLLGRRRRGRAACGARASRRRRCGSRDRDAELLLERLDQFG